MKNEKGLALVITLAILVVITAMVVEFAHGVYTTTTSLHNWKESQRLSLIAESGLSLGANALSDIERLRSYTYPAKIELPIHDMLPMQEVNRFKSRVIISAEDENSKFNVNSIVWPNGKLNERAYKSLKRLLRVLDLDETIADRLVDWIDKDSEPLLKDSEEGAKNAYLDSQDEMLLIHGVDKKSYEKLSPYITVYGINKTDDEMININTASLPVIISMHEDMTSDLAQRIVEHRDIKPFESPESILTVAGLNNAVGQSLMGRIAVKAANFRMISIAEDKGIKRIIECVMKIEGSSIIMQYWREV
ncbi:MAG: type II secretion system minor pseudopilin GspK [Thermodesulfovibrionales bacterium]|nr:type II secretion system minor pseudopilin GspK [Thermodesulfovibrionales bacterium]